MALIKCPTCGGSVSTSAVTCPHCGEPLQPQQPVQPTYQQPIYQQPVQQPQYQQLQPQQPMQISMPNLGTIAMILLGIVPVILLAIERAHFGESDLSMDMHKAVFGCMLSYASLYFLIQIFKNQADQFLATMCFTLGMFLLITNLYMWDIVDYTNRPTEKWIYENYEYFSMAYGLAVMLYAGSVKNWSRFVLLAAGATWLATLTWRFHGGVFLSKMIADHTLIIMGVIMATCLVCMMISWVMDSSNATKHPIARLLAGAEALLILATIIIVAVSAKDIIDANYEKGFEHVKLSTTFLLLSGGVSLVFALLFAREDKILYTMSAIYMGVAMFLILGYHLEFAVRAHDYWDEAYFDKLTNQTRDLYYSARFLLPISVMMTYVAEATKGITDQITIKMQ